MCVKTSYTTTKLIECGCSSMEMCLFLNQICKKGKIFLSLPKNCEKGGAEPSFFLCTVRKLTLWVVPAQRKYEYRTKTKN